MSINVMGNKKQLETKEELHTLLKSHSGILKPEILDYLKSLIELEFSVVRDYIDSNDRKALVGLELYKKIAIHNIYNRALSLFMKENDNLEYSGVENGLSSLMVSAKIDNSKVDIFRFDFNENRNSEISEEYKSMKIGNVNLYQSIESLEKRKVELNSIMDTLERLYSQTNPYCSVPGRAGGPDAQWEFRHQMEIRKCEEKFNQFDGKTELSDVEKREIDIRNKYHALLLGDYGLTLQDFEEEKKDIMQITRLRGYNSQLSKTLVKHHPNLEIRNNIKYL